MSPLSMSAQSRLVPIQHLCIQASKHVETSCKSGRPTRRSLSFPNWATTLSGTHNLLEPEVVSVVVIASIELTRSTSTKYSTFAIVHLFVWKFRPALPASPSSRHTMPNAGISAIVSPTYLIPLTKAKYRSNSRYIVPIEFCPTRRWSKTFHSCP